MAGPRVCIRPFRESGGSRKPQQQRIWREAQYRGRKSQFRGRESEFRECESQFKMNGHSRGNSREHATSTTKSNAGKISTTTGTGIKELTISV